MATPAPTTAQCQVYQNLYPDDAKIANNEAQKTIYGTFVRYPPFVKVAAAS